MLVTDKTELGHTRSLDEVQRVSRQVVTGLGVGLVLQLGLRVHLSRGLQVGRQNAFVDLGAVPHDVVIGGQHDLVLHRVDRGLHRVGRRRSGQIDVHRMGGHRDGDDEHDKQHEHDVDQRRRVHFAHRFAFGASG
jgi:hypothetical protein